MGGRGYRRDAFLVPLLASAAAVSFVTLRLFWLPLIGGEFSTSLRGALDSVLGTLIIACAMLVYKRVRPADPKSATVTSFNGYEAGLGQIAGAIRSFGLEHAGGRAKTYLLFVSPFVFCEKTIEHCIGLVEPDLRRDVRTIEDFFKEMAGQGAGAFEVVVRGVTGIDALDDATDSSFIERYVSEEFPATSCFALHDNCDELGAFIIAEVDPSAPDVPCNFLFIAQFMFFDSYRGLSGNYSCDPGYIKEMHYYYSSKFESLKKTALIMENKSLKRSVGREDRYFMKFKRTYADIYPRLKRIAADRLSVVQSLHDDVPIAPSGNAVPDTLSTPQRSAQTADAGSANS